MNLTPGWQQAPLPPAPPKCPHIGLLFAALVINRHEVGHEWVCTCGQVFVVVTGDGGKTKMFKMRGER